MPPRKVGRFRVEGQLGVGAFSKVLCGVDDTTGERYALKVRFFFPFLHSISREIDFLSFPSLLRRGAAKYLL